LGLLALAKFAEPAVASVLQEAASCLTDVVAQLGLSSIHLRRAIGVSPDALAANAEGHGAGRAPMGAYGPINGASHKRSAALGVFDLERNNARRRHHHARGVSVSVHLGKDVRRECLMTS
jgi:hypothetical protein